MRDDDWEDVVLDSPFQKGQSVKTISIQKWHYAAEEVMCAV